MILSLLLAAAIAVAPEAIVWKDGPPTLPAGSKIAVLEGDPRAAGMFTIRARVPEETVMQMTGIGPWEIDTTLVTD